MVARSSPAGWRALIAQIREDWHANGRELTRPGLHALVVNRLATHARSRIRSKVVRLPFAVVYRSLYLVCRAVYGIEFAPEAAVGRRLSIHHHQAVAIHPESVIGDDCIIRQGVTLGVRDRLDNKAAPTLGDRVEVGAYAQILGRITIGDDAVIGAGAVIARDVPPGWLAVGNPARIVKLG